MVDALLLKLGQHDRISDEERELLKRAFTRERAYSADRDIVSAGARPSVCTTLLDGFAARYKMLASGKRQITAILVPGDIIDLNGFLCKTMDQGVVALTACRVAIADHDSIGRITDTAPHLTRLLWLDTLIDAAIHREWLVAMGRRRKSAQLAHFICEIHMRLGIIEQTDGHRFHLPLSQAELADVLGISVVHFNRVLQELRQQGLITWSNHTVEIRDAHRLRQTAEFDPTYLSLQFEPR
ncbi:MAG: Crp/Fnr family transcriptional regulator [Rhizobiaceae bacterium]|nr:Crp/Fnr family transcriptional regulator [Rhizobiaceae bacterium]MCV0406058.1 Crp/Fnr family transcriptional regulator [Rhizobiaceae bacterium]